MGKQANRIRTGSNAITLTSNMTLIMLAKAVYELGVMEGRQTRNLAQWGHEGRQGTL